MRKTFFIAATALAVFVATALAQQARVTSPAAEYLSAPIALLPTNHPVVPRDLSQLWFVPPHGRAVISTMNPLAMAMQLNAKGEYAKALPVLSLPESQDGPYGAYAMYDAAVALLNLGQIEEASRLFAAVSERRPAGYLSEAALLGEALSVDVTDPSRSVPLYEKLLAAKADRQDEILWRLGSALRAAGQPDRAATMLARVYYEFPMSEFAAKAALDLSSMRAQAPLTAGSERYKLELARAERLFAAREYAPARTAFTSLKLLARSDDRELVNLRIAQTNYFLKRTREARDGLRPLLTTASRKAEVLYFQALTMRDLGNIAEYTKTVRRLAREFPTQRWAEEALNNYASYLIVQDEDDRADDVFRELYKLNPRGPYAERAAWKIGWRAFLEKEYADTVTFFERGASDFPRSDYRPPWLYWAGRAHEELGDQSMAAERYGLAAADYLNSYYGRLAVKRLNGRSPAPRVVDDRGSTDAASPTPQQTALIRSLVAAGLYTHAVNELRYAQRTTGDSPAIQATLAWLSHEQGREEVGQTRFTLLRGAITGMRRAYPQFLAAGGEQLPRELLTVIFPLEYWNLIKQYSDEYNLDPYLVSALVAQESTFSPDVRSAANAVGLMQLLPSTARQQAKKLNMTYSDRLLTDPDSNVRMGTFYFAEKLAEFGAVHLALASYNAGEAPVRRWVAERPGFGVEEFVDDIPYPETQNYVKRILGTAEDYRRLYSGQ